MDEDERMSEDERKAHAQRMLACRDRPGRGEVYRHYKGGLYVIVSVSLAEDTLEPLVTYRSNARGTEWTRTLRDFTEAVEWGVPLDALPRFRRVTQ